MHRLKATVVLLAGLTLAALPCQPVLAAKPQPAPDITTQRVAASLFSTPLTFEANEGQVDSQVKFLARGKGYTLFLTPTESVMVLQQREAKEQTSDIHDPLSTTEPASIKQSVVRMKLEGANPSPAIDGMEQLPGIVNYFIGNDPAEWRTKIPTYAKVQYKDAYPGIDLAYYGNQGKLEYDFIVAPGADPSQIKLAFEGASDIRVADSGDLVLKTTLGDVRVQKPIVYQLEPNGHKTLVAGNYVLQPTCSISSPSQGEDKGGGTIHTARATNHEVGIQLAAYDHTKPVVIDPVIVYSSFIGGAGQDNATDVAVDSSGNAWVVGWGGALNLSLTGTPYDASFNSGLDVFVMKISPAGTVLVWTYLGGAFNDVASSVGLDGAGNVWVTGLTGGSTFPITSGALRKLPPI